MISAGELSMIACRRSSLALRSASARRRSFAIEKRYLRADGTMVHALVHVSLMHGDG